MKYYWQISLFFLSLSAGVVGWMCLELGLLDDTAAYAGEATTATEYAGEAPVEVKQKERELKFREAEVKEREGLLKETLVRSEKAVTELKEKLAKKETELASKLAEKESEWKKRLAEKEAEWKKKLTDKESESKRKLAATQSEVSKFKGEIAKVKDGRAESYKLIYEKMESKKAAKILDELDVALATQILGDMKQEKAAEILSKMVPERARLITERPLRARSTASVAEQDSESTDPVNEAKPQE